MGKEIAQSGHRELVAGIVALYENTRKTITLFYWKTGQRIVEVEQKGEGKAVRSGCGIFCSKFAPDEKFLSGTPKSADVVRFELVPTSRAPIG